MFGLLYSNYEVALATALTGWTSAFKRHTNATMGNDFSSSSNGAYTMKITTVGALVQIMNEGS
jgi:hypothetical protein